MKVLSIIIGNIISFFGEIIDFVFGIKFNDKAKILIGNFGSCTCSIIALLFLGAYDGVINALVTLTRLITIYIKDKYHKKWNILFFVFIFLYSLSFLKFEGIRTIVLFISVMFSFIPKWLSKNMKLIRFCTLISYILIIIYNIFILNFAVLPLEVFSTIGIIIGLIKWYKKEKTK